MKKILSVTLIITMLVCLASCTHIGDTYFYPDEFTNEYCHNNYSQVDNTNYTVVDTYSNDAGGSAVIDEELRKTFYAIPDIDIQEFVVCEAEYGFGDGWGSTFTDLYRANDCNIDPINDWTIKSIEIGASSKTFFTTSESSLIEQLIVCINDKSNFFQVQDGGIALDKFISYSIEGEASNSYYSIKINFKETNMILWSAFIMFYEGHYYLAYSSRTFDNEDYDPHYDNIYYMPLTEELEEIISSTIQSVNQSNEST